MKGKKILAVMLSVGLAFGAAGCSQKPAQTAAAAETKAETTAAAETKAETAAETKAETAAAAETKAETAAESKAETKAASAADKAAATAEAVKTGTAKAPAGKTTERDFPGMGMMLTFPAAFDELKGAILLDGGEEMGYNTGLYYLSPYYLTMSEEEWENADQETALEALIALPNVIAINDGRGIPEINEIMGTDFTEADLKQIGKKDDMTYYCLGSVESADGIRKEYKDEYTELGKWYMDAIENAELYTPEETEQLNFAGETFTPETKDLDGNPVKLKDVFAENELTMVNFWGSFCPPCKAELPDLAELDKILKKKNCGVIGILVDSEIEESRIDDAKEVMKESGVEYPVYRALDTIDDKFSENGIPATIFVDREGKIVGDVILGQPCSNALEGYQKIIEGLLEGKSDAGSLIPADAEQNVKQDREVGPYQVIVKDENGKPVKDVMVQFCSDSQCMFGATDADGIANFVTDPGKYQVHILKAPDGFAQHTEVYEMTDAGSDLEIVLTKK